MAMAATCRKSTCRTKQNQGHGKGIQVKAGATRPTFSYRAANLTGAPHDNMMRDAMQRLRLSELASVPEFDFRLCSLFNTDICEILLLQPCGRFCNPPLQQISEQTCRCLP